MLTKAICVKVCISLFKIYTLHFIKFVCVFADSVLRWRGSWIKSNEYDWEKRSPIKLLKGSEIAVVLFNTSEECRFDSRVPVFFGDPVQTCEHYRKNHIRVLLNQTHDVLIIPVVQSSLSHLEHVHIIWTLSLLIIWCIICLYSQMLYVFKSCFL